MKRLISLLCLSCLSGSIATGTEGLGRAFDDQKPHGLAKIHATAEDAQKAFEKNTEYPMKVALKTPEYIFFNNGDLLSIGAPQFHYEMNERRVGF